MKLQQFILERAIVGAAYKDMETGKVYGPGLTHGYIQNDDELKRDFRYDDLGFDEFYNQLGAHMDAGRVVDGFLTDDGEFMNRVDAANAIRLQKQKTELGHRHGIKRNWLDSGDLTQLNPTVVEESTQLGYNGYAIDDSGKATLLARITPAFEHVAAHHITHLYGVAEELPPNATSATVIAIVQNDRAQAAIIEINGSTERPNGQTYHITISYDKAGGASAKDSNHAIQTSDWTPVSRFTLPLVPFWKPGAVAVRERGGVPQATSKTLYHGTTVEIARSAMKDGLYPNVGEFVNNYYGEEDGLDNLVFAADKKGMHKVIHAIGFHVGKKLGISLHQLTDKQLYQNGAILVIRSGMDQNDNMYHRSDDDEVNHDGHPSQVEPGDYYGYEIINPDYMLTGIQLKRFLTRLGLAQDNRSILHTPQRINLRIRQGDLPKPVREDVESDHQTSIFLSKMAASFEEKIRHHLDTPFYNPDNLFARYSTERVVKFRGAQFGWPGLFKSLWIVLRTEDKNPKGGMHVYERPDGTKEYVISFAVLPVEDGEINDGDRVDIALSRMVSDQMIGIMVHELHHIVLDIRGVPQNGKGSFLNGEPDQEDYYNSPFEFDAHYQQLTRKYQVLLALLRHNPSEAVGLLKKLNFARDFKIALQRMLPTNFEDDEWGIWYYARQKQNRRLTNRLYQLHSAIVTEIDRQNMGAYLTEDTDKDAQQSAFLRDMIQTIQNRFKEHIRNPIFDPEERLMDTFGDVGYLFVGDDFGFTGEYEGMWIHLRGENTEPRGGYQAYKNVHGEQERILSFAVMPATMGNDPMLHMNRTLVRMTTPAWTGVLFHELHHMTQDINKLPVFGKNAFQNQDDMSDEDYFNSPIEFDAMYQQLTRDLNNVLNTLRSDPDLGYGKAEKLNFNPNFPQFLEDTFATNKVELEHGIWHFAKKHQKQRLIKRLYALHQAIVKELNQVNIHEDDNRDQHQDALDTTGYWGNAGAGCIIMAMDTKRLLLPLRSEWVQEPGTWATWGGAIDQGEDPKAAAIRELQEEAGYQGSISQIHHLYQYKDKGFRYDTFLILIPTEFDPSLNWETERAEWVDYTNLPSPLHFGLKAVLSDKSVQNKLGSLTSR